MTTPEDLYRVRGWELHAQEVKMRGWKRFWIWSGMITLSALLVGWGLSLMLGLR